jgi:antitoxin CptB
MYNIFNVTKKLEILKKRLIYRASYRGTKEMDILLSSFVNKYINELDSIALADLEVFLEYEDELILNYYNNKISIKKIEGNKISQLFKKHKI